MMCSDVVLPVPKLLPVEIHHSVLMEQVMVEVAAEIMEVLTR